MDGYELAGMLFGHKRAESDASERLRDLTISGVAESDSADGLVSISLDGDLTQAEDDGLEHDHTILIPTEVGVYTGDEVAVTLTGADLSTLRVTGVVGDGDRVNARISGIEADYVKATELEADIAEIGYLKADSAVITDIQADTAKVHNLTAQEISAATGYVADLEAGNVTAQQLVTDHAKVGQLDVDQIEADHATIGTLDTTYMHADMANADVAWIQNGTIKNGAIVSAMINDVSANKLTAGTINGSVINVTNLNADNITTGTINGQRIGEGSLSLDKLSEDVYTEAEVDTIVDGLNDRIDGAIETHTGTAVPTLNNAPASSWNTTKLRDEHVGDVYYVVNSQSQQNGYCYRFTKSGSTYSWQLIKDSDVTAALSRLTTAEGKIMTFDSDISTLKTTTGTLTTKTESLETRMSDAEEDILDKVDTTTFNEVSDTVDQHSQTISQHTTAISNKADSSTVTAVTNRVSKNEQDISGINTTIGELQDTVESKADGSTVSTISNKLNTVSDTVDGHTQTLTSVQNTLSSKADSSTVSTLTTKVNTIEDTVDGHTSQLSSITSTQTTMQSTLDKTVKSSIQLWYSKANTTAPNKPTSRVTSTSTSGNAWRIVVPAYNASYPHYYYCWQYEYTDGTYGWSAVVRDIAMGESQSTARTADSNASAAVTTANTASTNASTALSTANTANTNATEAKTTATTANTTASEAKTTAETAASDASTAKTNAASAVTTANSASTTATNAQTTANANIKSSVQLWFTKANSTAPNKPTSVVSTSNANTANAWNLVVPVWNKNYPHYFYCYQQQKGDGNYQWTDVVYDRATSEAQQLANTTSTNLTTLQEDYATYKQTTTENVSSIGTRLTTAEGKISTAETNISQNANNIALKVSESDVTGNYLVGKINLNSTTASIAAEHINLQGAVTISDLSSDAQSATLNSSISVGGRNLLKGTKDYSTKSTANQTGITVSSDTFGGTKVLVGTWSSGNMDMGRFANAFSVSLQPDSDYTLSFWAKATAAINVVSYLFTPSTVASGKNSSGNTTTASDGTITTTLSTEWKRYWVTWHTSTAASQATQVIAARVNSSAREKTVYVAGVKFEQGNKFTDWSPAPEDVDSAISNAAKTATSYVTDITGGGIMVHPSGDSTTGVQITDDVDILRDGTSVINIGTNDAIRIGAESSNHVEIDSNELMFHDGTNAVMQVGGSCQITEKHVCGSSTSEEFYLSLEPSNGATFRVIDKNGEIVTSNYTLSRGEKLCRLTNKSGTALDGETVLVFYQSSGMVLYDEGDVSSTFTTDQASFAGGMFELSYKDTYSSVDGTVTDSTAEISIGEHRDQFSSISLNTMPLYNRAYTTFQASGNGYAAFVLDSGSTDDPERTLDLIYLDRINYADPYGGSDRQLGVPTRLTASGSYKAGTSDTMGPAVTLTAGIWLVEGIWNFANSSSNAKRLTIGLYRSSTVNAFTYRVHTTASSNAAHRIEVVDFIVVSAASETVTLYGASSPASTSAATQFITAVRLA